MTVEYCRIIPANVDLALIDESARVEEPVASSSSSEPVVQSTTEQEETRSFFGFKIRRGGARRNEEPQ
jgi:hypothetical protein